HASVVMAAYDLPTWDGRERIPFAAGIEAGADLLMTTHLRLPAFDDQIVTGSRDVIEMLARRQLGFNGPIITDDLIMSGADNLGDIGKRTVRAFLAGHDLLLFGRDTDAAMEAYGFFLDAYENGEIPAERLQEALGRISSLKIKLDSAVLW
ncbi:MAG: glycoside hydrolase family 3 N-terminal domain-containing protein, partial [Candidatus Zixiibacteriota bacterium]